MAVSEAKLEANRRNSQKSSTGPRTEAGKSRSKLNAVKHGMRAATLVLLDEDAQALEDRRNAWNACLLPGDDVEQRLVEDAVVSTWHQDRARRAQIARLNTNILNYGVSQTQTNEQEVAELGRQLFTDRMGPLTFYPTGCDYSVRCDRRHSTTSFAVCQSHELDRPADLVLRLQATLLGCEWLLGEWAGLKAILERGQPWVPSDKLKAVRLLGKEPFDAIDDQDVALVFLASFVLKGDKGQWYWEISTEMNEPDTKRFRQNAADRQLESLKPEDATKAREALMGIIERATERLTLKAEAHRERAQVQAALASDILAFDDSVEGERLRRYELASGRGLARSLDLLQKHRRAANQNDTRVTTGTIEEFDVHQRTVSPPEENVTNEPTDDQHNATNEPTDACENMTNEPTDACENTTNEPTDAYQGAMTVLSGIRSRSKIKSRIRSEDRSPAVNGEIATNEPTADSEILTNEPTDACENTTNEPTDAYQGAMTVLSGIRSRSTIKSRIRSQDRRPAVNGEIATNEPTADIEIVTNEPTAHDENMTNEPTLAADVGLESPTYMNATEQNGSNPPVRGMLAGMNDRDDSDFHEEINPGKAVEWMRAELATIEAIQAERLREWNEECQGEAKEANAGRRPRPEWHNNGKPADQSKKRAARTKPRTTGTNTARTVGDSAEPVNTGSELTIVEEQLAHSDMRERAR